MPRLKSNSAIGNELFCQDVRSPLSNINNKFFRMNSWSNEYDIKEKEKEKERRKSTGLINLKKKFNLKKIFLDLISSEFDKDILSNLKNMRNASKKLLMNFNRKENKI